VPFGTNVTCELSTDKHSREYVHDCEWASTKLPEIILIVRSKPYFVKLYHSGWTLDLWVVTGWHVTSSRKLVVQDLWRPLAASRYSVKRCIFSFFARPALFRTIGVDSGDGCTDDARTWAYLAYTQA
jgi:hypothetical protein